MIKNRTIVMFATVPWHWNWQRQHEWASRFAENNRVIYISNVGIINHSILGLLRKFFKHKGPAQFEHKLTDIQKRNLIFLTPFYIPWHGWKWLNRINAKLIWRKIKHAARPEEKNLILWLCTPSDTLVPLLERFPNVPKIYDIAMRFAERKDVSQRVKKDQNEIAEKVSVIFYDAKAHLDDLPKNSHKKAQYIPQGINEIAFKTKTDSVDPLGTIEKPRLGYVGALHDSINYTLLRDIIEKIPNAHLIIVGPYVRIPKILAHPRISFVGAVPFEIIPNYLSALDIGLIPYEINDYTLGVFPTKFFEYLAAGLPVVSTNLPELRQFSDKVYLASSTEEFIDGIYDALTKTKTSLDPAFLENNSWQSRFSMVNKSLEKLT